MHARAKYASHSFLYPSAAPAGRSSVSISKVAMRRQLEATAPLEKPLPDRGVGEEHGKVAYEG